MLIEVCTSKQDRIIWNIFLRLQFLQRKLSSHFEYNEPFCEPKDDLHIVKNHWTVTCGLLHS